MLALTCQSEPIPIPLDCLLTDCVIAVVATMPACLLACLVRNEDNRMDVGGLHTHLYGTLHRDRAQEPGLTRTDTSPYTALGAARVRERQCTLPDAC